ncbi:MAG: alpha/beta fold hydrolase [Clostridia bacterium]|nr:alpha/beta fold hydrolase [Clostridia bacterium]
MAAHRFSERAQPFLLEGGAHGVLLLHGFTATPAMMYPLGKALHANLDVSGQRPTVQGILLPGHGTRIQDMRSHGGYTPWLNAAIDAFDALAARCDRVSVIGHSMGGVLALLLAQQRPVHNVIPIAAPMRLCRFTARLAPYIGWAIPFTVDKRGPGEDCDLGYAGMAVCRVGDLLRLMRQAERNLAQISCPILVVQPINDETVRAASANIIYNGVSSQRKELLWLERSGHGCVIGPEHQQLFDACGSFLRG